MTDPEQEKLKHNSAGSRIGQPQAGPSDVGEGKLQGRSFHKPNEKHTLDEVLKSLQDLIHNDLLRDQGQPVADTPLAPEAAGGEAPPAADDPAPAIEPTGPDVPFESVVASLEQLVTRELATGDGEPATEMPTAEIEAAPAPAPEPTPAKTPDAGQQTFAFDDGETAAMDLAPTGAPLEPPPLEAEAPPPEPEVEEISLDAADVPVLNDPVLDTEPPPAADDIPVLEDVALAPPPDDPAEDIAARVVERLNAERRARGEPELDAAALDTLRALLRDELAHRPPEK